MKGDIRLPLALLKIIANSPDNVSKWEYTAHGGELLVATRHEGLHPDGTPWCSIDFIYDPLD